MIMKFNQIVANIRDTAAKVGGNIQKHSPELLIGAAIVGFGGSLFLACKATLKVNKTIEESKETIQKIHTAAENGVTEAGEEYTEEDSKRELSIVYIQTGVKIVKEYAPALILGSLSIAAMLASNDIQRKRYGALAAAYATVDKSFKEYRGRVAEKFGDEVEYQIRHDLKAVGETEETVTDENGEENVVKKTVYETPVAKDGSPYARFFDKYTHDDNGDVVENTYWERNGEYNLLFLKKQERYANDLLRARKILFLNEVYDMLGMPKTKAGQIVGWVYDPSNPDIDNYVDFGLAYLSGSEIRYAYSHGEPDPILVDFNVDGDVWSNMKLR